MKPQLNLRPLKRDSSITTTISSENRRPNLSRPTLKCRPSWARRAKDRFWVELTTNAQAAESYSIVLDRLLALKIGAEQRLEESLRIDPGFALGHAVAATILADETASKRQPAPIWIRLGEQPAGPVIGRPVHQRGRVVVQQGVLLDNQPPTPRSALARRRLRSLASHPQHPFARGQRRSGRSVAAAHDLVAVHGDDWWLMSFRAFGRTDSDAGTRPRNTLGPLWRPSRRRATPRTRWRMSWTKPGATTRSWRGWTEDRQRRGHQLFRSHSEWHRPYRGRRRRYRRRPLALRPELACLRGNRSLVDAGSLLVRASLHGCGLGRRRPDAVDHQPARRAAPWLAVPVMARRAACGSE